MTRLRPRTQALRRLAGAQAIAVRELRLLFGLLLILFLTAEVWRYAGRLDGVRLAFVLVAALGAMATLVGVGLRRTLPAAMSRAAAHRAALRVAGEARFWRSAQACPSRRSTSMTSATRSGFSRGCR